MVPASVCAALLVLSGSLAGCRSLPPLDWNPLLRVEHTPEGAVEIEALGPFVDVRLGPEGVSHALRPLYQRKAGLGDSHSLDFLAPFGRHWSVGSGTRWRFWPLVWSGVTEATEEGTRWRGVFFPIVFAGAGPGPRDDYFALFPIAGRTHQLFGMDTWDFFLWPFFIRAHQEVTESSTSWTVLLLAGWTNGGPRDRSWRLLPFYRRRIVRTPEGELRTDLHTVLWPFFTFGIDHAAPGDDAGRRIAFWPLYSREVADGWRKDTVLWPFVRYYRETEPAPELGGGFHYDMPWPFFRWQRSDDESTFRIWPFYSHHQVRNLDSTVWMWPLVWHRRTTGQTLDEDPWWPTRGYERTDLWVLPVWHSMSRHVDGRTGLDRELQVWPLFHRDTHPDGWTDAAFPSLTLARNWDFMRPFDELFSPFWTLWRFRSDGPRDETRLLFDSVLHRTGPEGVTVSVPFLYSRRPDGGGVHRHQVLWGLGGWRTGPEGLAAVSLAGIDLWRR